MKTFLILFLCIFTPNFVSAQGINPIEVTADNALSWDRTNRTFTANGNAIITQGKDSINAPNITAFYDEGDKIVIRQVIAEPNAVLKQPDQTLTANKVIADFKDGVLDTVTATKDVVLKTENEMLYGDQAIYNTQDRTISVTGNVRIEQEKNIMTGNRATFDMNTNISTMTASPQSGGRVKATFFSGSSK